MVRDQFVDGFDLTRVTSHDEMTATARHKTDGINAYWIRPAIGVNGRNNAWLCTMYMAVRPSVCPSVRLSTDASYRPILYRLMSADMVSDASQHHVCFRFTLTPLIGAAAAVMMHGAHSCDRRRAYTENNLPRSRRMTVSDVVVDSFEPRLGTLQYNVFHRQKTVAKKRNKKEKKRNIYNTVRISSTSSK